jgi:hypothetical protein
LWITPENRIIMVKETYRYFPKGEGTIISWQSVGKQH